MRATTRRLGHGVVLQHPRAEEASAFDIELRAWQQAIRQDIVFTGITAARVHGLWLPPLDDNIPLWAEGWERTARPERRQIIATRHPTTAPSTSVRGIRVAPVPQTILGCARDLELLDLVPIVDHALSLKLATRRELEDVARQRRRGAPLMRVAIKLADRRSESPMETLLRVFHVMSDVPVTPQVNLCDEKGMFVARADLLIDGTCTLQEYDGEGHLRRDQYRDDRHRDSRLVTSGFVRHGYTSHDVTRDYQRILLHADLALAREHDPTRLSSWRQLLAASTRTATGRERLRYRIERRLAAHS